MQVSINNQVTLGVAPMYMGQDIIIAIDSSKTNSAFTVGDMSHRVLDYFEFNGSAIGTAVEDTLHMCSEQRKVLRTIFQGANPRIVGIEDIITKALTGTRNGMTEHTSRFKITAVFMSFISFFQDEFGVTPELVNNWTWKSTVLPEQYCSRRYDKGSLQYFKDIGSPYGNCSDDVTDSLCIFEYLCRVHDIESKLPIKGVEFHKYNHTAVIVCCNRGLSHPTILFEYNKELTLEQNANVMSNNIDIKHAGIAVIPTVWLTLPEIYKYCKGKFDPCEDTVKLVVIRKE